MTRETSIEAYKKIQADGSLSKAQMAVYGVLFADGPMTRNELDARLSPGRPNAMHSRRLSEMERRGVVKRCPARACRVSGHTCETWDVTGQPPGQKVSAPRTPPMPAGADCAALSSVVRSAIDGGLVPEVTVAAARALSEWLAAGAPYSRRRAARRKKKTPGRGAAGGAGRSDSQSSKNVDTACEPIRPVPAETHRTDAPGQFIEL